MKKRLLLPGVLVLLLVVAVMAAACGGEETTTTAAPATQTTAPAGTDTTTQAGTDTTAAATKEDVLKIGAISSVTGDMAAAFKAMYDSVGPTQELLNEMGGLTLGDTHYTIEIDMYDDQSTTAGALTAINKLIADGVKFVVPPMFMPNDLAIAPLCEEKKIIRVKSAGAGNAEVNPDNPCMFFSASSLTNMEPFYSHVMGKYPNVKRVAVITPDDPGGKTFEDMIRTIYEKLGIEIVYWEVYPMPSFDFYSILNKALATKPDAIEILYGIPPCSAAVVNQSRELGYTGPIFGSVGPGDPNVINSLLTPEFAYDLVVAGPEVYSDGMTSKVQALKEKVVATGASFEMDSILLLDAISAMLAVLDTAQSLEPDEFVAAVDSGACNGF